jgi:hypothetical protein
MQPYFSDFKNLDLLLTTVAMKNTILMSMSAPFIQLPEGLKEIRVILPSLPPRLSQNPNYRILRM